jgi:uncharacterized membrane protein YhaH (DUF805 family)
MDWYLMVWKKYANFNGRARRKEYWMFSLFHLLVFLVLELTGFALLKSGIGIAFLVLVFVYAMAAIIPSLSVGVRRLHDIGKSGWWMFIGLIPFIGGLILFIFTVLDSDPGMNEYGPNPKFDVLSAASY